MAARPLATVSALAACSSPPEDDREPAPTAMTTSGSVRGVEQDGIRRFLGIPYAAPPLGERRWQPPQPASPWTGIRDATAAEPVCAQPEAPDMPADTPRSEDCLPLEVTAPADGGAGRPVMVWLPGGGFVTGAGSIHDPTRLVEAGDVVVVTVNYRLGVFGFFAHSELGNDSNFGLQDQAAAVRWVRDNIAELGGDPAQVTLAGASAGGMSACTLMTSPAAEGLFQRAIVHSGSCLTGHPAGAIGEGVDAISSWHPISTIQGTGQALAEELSCPDVACLREKPADELLPYTMMSPLVAYGTDLVPAEPARAFAEGSQAAVPLLRGNARDEHVEFILTAYPEGITTDQYSELLDIAFDQAASDVERRYPVGDFPSPTAAASRVFSDRDWICPTRESARHLRTRGADLRLRLHRPLSAAPPAGSHSPGTFDPPPHTEQRSATCSTSPTTQNPPPSNSP
ncbi:carboxylesterase family protein [Streptomyces sp. 8K308]|uniref:carboxylesterase/lipase family protein n=1 Tax=Streptomyces sp. 8K308 TaxID=2530388 RepID=UPI00104A6945|nr:carboxylesterase family protein [Streptomyces sp. 8K308]TDC25569.1 carboxylesterase family protein [Streptomyces sp. 8K308]